MPKTCAAWNCNSHNLKDTTLCFSVFPNREKQPDRWEKWVSVVRRYSDDTCKSKWVPSSKWTYLCGNHFITGASNKDPKHPDHIPSRFAHNQTDEKRNEEKLKRYSSAKNRTEVPKKKTVLMCKNKLVFSSPIPKELNMENLPSVEDISESYNLPTSSKKQKVLGSIENCPAFRTNLRLPGRSPSLIDETEEFDEELMSPRYTTEDADNTDYCEEDDQGPQMEEVGDFDQDPHTYTAVPFSHSKGLKRPLEQSEREMLYNEIDYLKEENRELKDSLRTQSVSYRAIENKDSETRYLTGLPWCVFFSLYTYLSQFMVGSKIRCMSLENQFLVTVIKLRLNIQFEYLAIQNNVACSSVTKIFWRWINLMHAKLGFLVKWSDRGVIKKTIPPPMKALFPRLTGIIDCFEIFIERPKGLLARAKSYSNYKKHSIIKILISCSPNGAINFMSTCWGGRVSDVELVRQSGLLTLPDHMPGDQILADRGFILKDDFAMSCGVELIYPNFTKGKLQLPAGEVEDSRQTASVRIHIERVIGLMRNRYTILQGPVPLNFVKSVIGETKEETLCSFDKILRVCGALTNSGGRIVYSE